MVCFLFGYVVVRFREAPLSQLAVHSQLSGQAAPSSGGGLGLDDRLCGYQLADLRVCGLPDSPHRGHQSLSLLPDDLSWPLGGWFTGWAGHWAPWRMTWMASAGREYRSSGTFAADSQSTAIVASSASDPTIRACCELGDGKAVCNTMTLGTSTPVSMSSTDEPSSSPKIPNSCWIIATSHLSRWRLAARMPIGLLGSISVKMSRRVGGRSVRTSSESPRCRGSGRRPQGHRLMRPRICRSRIEWAEMWRPVQHGAECRRSMFRAWMPYSYTTRVARRVPRAARCRNQFG